MDLADIDFNVEIENIEPTAILGFDGKVLGGLKVHPSKSYLLYPLGTRIVISHVKNNRQKFLIGHTNTISTLDVSASGEFVASGQVSHMGYRSYVIVWDWLTRSEKSRHELHRICVESLVFTANDAFLISLGGQDDGYLVVWDVKKCAPLCGKIAVKEITGHAKRVCALKTDGYRFLTAGEQNLRIWTIDTVKAKLTVHDANVGKIRRIFTCMRVHVNDDIMYAGTTSGDIVKIQLNCTTNNDEAEPNVMQTDKVPTMLGCYGRHNPKKIPGKDCENYMRGVGDLAIIYGDRMRLLIGAGDGTVELVEERNAKFKDYPLPTWPQLKSVKRKKVIGAVTSLSTLDADVLIGTNECEVYLLHVPTFELKLRLTCNTSIVYDIAFPNDFSGVFATASYQSVRIWSLMKKQELLRVMVPNFSAAAVIFSYDGKSIISAWNDGTIRAFTPLTGKLIYAIPHAHNKGCTALTISRNNSLLVSGGCEGQIRFWKIDPIRQSLLTVLKEHTAPIASLHFNCFDREIVSASGDGTCIIWDIARQVRKQILIFNTQFTCAQFFPTGVQILATGCDRRITYWEVYDASLVREFYGSDKGSINCLSLNNTGEMFASAGNDQLIKLWDYQKGIQLGVCSGHATSVVTCKYSPCGKYIVSGSTDGAVIIWNIPEKFWPHPGVDPLAPALEINTKKPSKYDKRPEDIKELESSRSKKDLHICECPPLEESASTTSGPCKK